METVSTENLNLKVINARRFSDERGYFYEAFNWEKYRAALNLKHTFAQDNVSSSKHGVLRGLHYQYPQAQGKLVSVIQGEVFDVAVDIRRGSPTYGQWDGVVLSESNQRQFWVPRGFAHGFVVLSDHAIFAYKCDEYYAPMNEKSVAWNDPALNIQWQIKAPIVSPKDSQALMLEQISPDELPRYEDGSL